MSDVFDLENGVMDLDALRRDDRVPVQAEWVVLEHQMRIRLRETLEMVWLEDAQLAIDLEEIQARRRELWEIAIVLNQ